MRYVKHAKRPAGSTFACEGCCQYETGRCPFDDRGHLRCLEKYGIDGIFVVATAAEVAAYKAKHAEAV